jgi:hypothetical protein
MLSLCILLYILIRYSGHLFNVVSGHHLLVISRVKPLYNGKFIFKMIPEFKLEAQWAETVSLTIHSALRKLNIEPLIGVSHQVLVIWLTVTKKKIFRNRPIK